MGSIIIVGIAFLLSAGLLHLSTSLAGIDRRSFGKAVATTIALGIVSWVLNGFFGLFNLHTSWFAIIVAFAVDLAMLKAIYATTWGKAILAWVIHVVVLTVLIIVPLVLVAGLFIAGGGMHW